MPRKIVVLHKAALAEAQAAYENEQAKRRVDAGGSGDVALSEQIITVGPDNRSRQFTQLEQPHGNLRPGI